MPNPSPDSPEGEEKRVDEVIAAYLKEVRLGQEPSREALLARHPERIALPRDVATADAGERHEVAVAELPIDSLLLDVGETTIAAYEAEIAAAGTVFVNGPAGAYEQEGADLGTRRLWAAVAAAPGMTAIGGGDTVASASKFVDLDRIDFVQQPRCALRTDVGSPRPEGRRRLLGRGLGRLWPAQCVR